MRNLIQKLYQRLNHDVHKNLLLNGKLLGALNNNKSNISSLEEVEFQVFSQRGEDGIIQYLINKIEIPNKIFIEFGVENYVESNTRYLLTNNNWEGLVIDESASNINYIKNDFIYWKHDITAIQSFITKDNINGLIRSRFSEKDIGLLSIDVDGNDYWIWDAIDTIQPRIIVCEYNSWFGDEMKLTIPYKSNFSRTDAHYSNLYFGASLPALCHLAVLKGYDFLGTASAGVNAFFIRKDLSSPFKIYNAKDGYCESANRDSRGENGQLTFLRHAQRLKIIQNLPLVDLNSNEEVVIKDLFDLSSD